MKFISLFAVILLNLLLVRPVVAAMRDITIPPLRDEDSHFVLIEDERDGNIFLINGYYNTGVQGAARWTKDYGDTKYISILAYADTFHKNGEWQNIQGMNFDMWEEGPISHPYLTAACKTTQAGCNAATAESNNAPAVVDERGFYGVMGAPQGSPRAKLSPHFIEYLKAMHVGGKATRTVHFCFTPVKYDARAGQRCVDQTEGIHAKQVITLTKIAHMRIKNRHKMANVTIDSNGNMAVVPGTQGCINYKHDTQYSGVLCEMLSYDMRVSTPTVVNNGLKVYLQDPPLNDDSGVDYTFDGGVTWLSHWATSGTLDFLNKVPFGEKTLSAHLDYWALRRPFPRIIDLDNAIKIRAWGTHARGVKNGAEEFLIPNSTSINIQPRDYSVTIISADGQAAPYQAGSVGRDILRFPYEISESGPLSANKLEISVTQDQGIPDAGRCTFYGEEQSAIVPIPTLLKFDTNNGSLAQPVRCDRVPVDIRALGIKDSRPQENWTNPLGISRYYSLALEFDLTDPVVQRTVQGGYWEGEVHQSGTITIKGTWN
ncbi:TPA: hypothetical protein ACSP84_003847 [Aeromonas veronii]